MRSEADIREVFRLAALGLSQWEVSRRSGVPHTTVQRWLTRGELSCLDGRSTTAHHSGTELCPLVAGVDRDAYAYLLGQYLGDGHIVLASKGVYRLEVFCCAAYPGIIEECAAALAKILPANKVGFRSRPGVVAVGSYSKHLPCLFPQHGPGPKHKRPIVLEPWQEKIAVDEHPRLFLRGLIHSDGYRGMNKVRGSNGSPYAYPRYQFSNRSLDLQRLFVFACVRLGIECRQMNRWTISVARRGSVEHLDTFVGPKF